MDRRSALRLMSMTGVAGILDWTAADLVRAAEYIESLPAAGRVPLFFDAHEWRTVHVLVDLIIPRDDRSGSATDAKVPEFIDFMMNEASSSRQSSMRSGLTWLDGESVRRFGVTFVAANAAQQRAILDDISWPDRARDEMRSGVDFFNMFRDMTAGGFFSSRMGYADLQYMGRPKREWPGCPEPALRKLGVDYGVMEVRR